MLGVLTIDKPAGKTSRDVVNHIQRIVRPAKVGHTGTLDPLATGVLLVAVGSATRLVEFSHDADKEYDAEFQLGCSSDTLDVDGNVQPLVDPPIPTLEQLAEETRRWLGRVQQTPPRFSAVHVQGRRAHELARRGEAFELPPREVTIHALDILEYDPPHLRLRIVCGSGTYVRSLGSDIARGLGTDAVMSRLTRTRVGPIALAGCVGIDAIRSAVDVGRHLRPALCLAAHLPMIALDDDLCRRLRLGQPLPPMGEVSAPRVAALDGRGELVAVLERVDDATRDECDATATYRSLRVLPDRRGDGSTPLTH